MGAQHPECPQRLDAIQDRLIAAGLDQYLQHYDAPEVSQEQLLRAHARPYLERLEDLSLALSGEERHALDPDTALCPHTLAAARRAAGAGVLAVDLLMQGRISNAFCAVRPPGHHAERAQAMGFCFYNNIAIAALHAVAAWGLKRVAIVDFDVHHGNGTENILSNHPDILMLGCFQHPFYPYSGTESRAANMLNVPLPAGTTGEAWRAALAAQWWPRLAQYAPELILVSAGFDGHREDDMAQWQLVEADYAWVTEALLAQAHKSAGGCIAALLEGGYELSALGRSAVTMIKVLAGL